MDAADDGQDRTPKRAGLLDSDHEKTLNYYLRRFLIPFNVCLGSIGIVKMGILTLVCWGQAADNPRIWLLLLVPLAGLGLGAIIGFLYASIGVEEKRFGPALAALNGVLGGAAISDLARENSVIRVFFGDLAAECGLQGGSIVFIVSISAVAVGFLTIYATKMLLLNPSMLLQNPSLMADVGAAKEALSKHAVGGRFGPPAERTAGGERTPAPISILVPADTAVQPSVSSTAVVAPTAALETGAGVPEAWGGQVAASLEGEKAAERAHREEAPVGFDAARVADEVAMTPSPSPVPPQAGAAGLPPIPVLDPNDPQKGRWGGHEVANGRRLCATVKPAAGTPGWFLVRLQVRSVDPARPLTGSAQFHLHPTFKDPVSEVNVEDGVATLNVVAWGAFTVGAVCDHGATMLELDLATLPDVPAAFAAR